MATKTAISLPDELFARADSLARRQKLSRSKLIARALDAYLATHDREHLIADLNRLADLKEDRDLERFVRETGRGALARVEWID